MVDTTKEGLDRSNPNYLPSLMQEIKAGTLLAGLIPVVTLRPTIASAAVHVHTVPGTILTVSTGATAVLIVDGLSTPGAGEVAITYDSEGIATLTFQAANTTYDVTQHVLPALLGTAFAKLLNS